MTRQSSKLAALMLPLLIMSGIGNTSMGSDLLPEDIDTAPKEPPIPKGCKEYFFDTNGYYTSRNEYAFKCIATSHKYAVRKFNNWMKSRP